MKIDQFESLYDRMVEKEKDIIFTKGKEYANNEDQLKNFKCSGEELGIAPEVILSVFLKKHMDSIFSYIKNKQVYSEPIEDRIADARVYLSLLLGLIVDMEENDGK